MLRLCGLALVIAMVFAACGSSDSSSPTTGAESTTPPSSTEETGGSTEAEPAPSEEGESAEADGSSEKTAFIKEADEICERADEAKLEALAETARNEKAAIRAALQQIQVEAEELAALEPPSGDEDEIAEIVAGIEQGVKETEEQGAEAIDRVFAPTSAQAKAYGFDACATPY